MKVIVIILIIAVLLLCFIQSLTRVEINRLREKEIAYDAQISVLQERSADLQLNMDACLKDVRSNIERINSNRSTCVDIFATMDEHIHTLEQQISELSSQVKHTKKESNTTKENNKK